jgi:AcrR family transcriptional regulator
MAPRTRRREQIREVALRLFAARGFYGTGMEDIAAELGMGTSSLYNHWNSKQDLLVDIMLTTMVDLIAGFERTVRGDCPSVDLRCVMEAHGRHPAGRS